MNSRLYCKKAVWMKDSSRPLPTVEKATASTPPSTTRRSLQGEQLGESAVDDGFRNQRQKWSMYHFWMKNFSSKPGTCG